MSTDAQLRGGERVLTFLRLLRDTHAHWLDTNAIGPKNGELIIVEWPEPITNKILIRFKIGDGTTEYENLDFIDDAIKDTLEDFTNT